MKIAKPLLLISTPIGVVAGIREAGRFHAILAVLMALLIGVIALFIGWTVHRVRTEQRSLRSPQS